MYCYCVCVIVQLNTFDEMNMARTVHDLADGVLLHKVMYTM